MVILLQRCRAYGAGAGIATCLSSLDALTAAETQKHAALQRPKRGLMQQLFPSPEEVEA